MTHIFWGFADSWDFDRYAPTCPKTLALASIVWAAVRFSSHFAHLLTCFAHFVLVSLSFCSFRDHFGASLGAHLLCAHRTFWLICGENCLSRLQTLAKMRAQKKALRNQPFEKKALSAADKKAVDVVKEDGQ